MIRIHASCMGVWILHFEISGFILFTIEPVINVVQETVHEMWKRSV